MQLMHIDSLRTDVLLFLLLPTRTAAAWAREIMNGVPLPPTLILSGLLAILALLLNVFSPGLAALVGAIAALVFIKLLIFGK
jgi:hypothetical protein